MIGRKIQAIKSAIVQHFLFFFKLDPFRVVYQRRTTIYSRVNHVTRNLMESQDENQKKCNIFNSNNLWYFYS